MEKNSEQQFEEKYYGPYQPDWPEPPYLESLNFKSALRESLIIHTIKALYLPGPHQAKAAEIITCFMNNYDPSTRVIDAYLDHIHTMHGQLWLEVNPKNKYSIVRTTILNNPIPAPTGDIKNN